jgi:hypothetical protein
MHDRHILGLARARRDDGAPAGRPRRVERRLRLADVPAWFGFTSTALQAPMPRLLHPLALVTRKSSPTICTRSPTAAVKRRNPSASCSPSGSSIDTIGYGRASAISISAMPSLSSVRPSRASW